VTSLLFKPFSRACRVFITVFTNLPLPCMLSRVMWALFPLLTTLLGISHALGTSVSTSASSTATSNDSSSVSTATTDTSSAAVSTETGDLTVPISSYTFSPFPTPKQTPVSGVFPATNPKDPPAPGNASVVPDFAPAWAAAYHKAKTRVSHLLMYVSS
jgi:hypothetical protein